MFLTVISQLVSFVPGAGLSVYIFIAIINIILLALPCRKKYKPFVFLLLLLASFSALQSYERGRNRKMNLEKTSDYNSTTEKLKNAMLSERNSVKTKPKNIKP